jgi:superfamily II DNA or RNA helicase
VNCIHDKTAVNYASHINLYPYQESAVNTLLLRKNGILVSPCGSGKTQMALEIIARIGGKALWLTHTGELLTQSMERAKACFDLPLHGYGTITAGKVNIGSAITFATVQTMCNIDLKEYAREWDVVIVDECHKAIGTPTKIMQFYKVLSNLQARYKIGVTATPKRADGLERCMTALLGNIEHTIPKEEVKKFTCPVTVMRVETDYKPNLDVVLAGDGTIIYSSLINDLIQCEKRNGQIACDVAYFGGMKNAKVLVLSDRVEHLTKLRELICFMDNNLNGKVKQLMALSNSKKAREERRQVLKDLNDGKINVVLATYALAKEGLDVPNLNYVVFASPVKDATTVEQASGRVGRKAENKPYGVVIDYVDSNFGMLAGFSKKRNSVYKKLEYEIM